MTVGSGSGETTVGALLAGRLHWPFEDADDLHPKANIDDKMRAGFPLADEDRWPWLRAVAAWSDACWAEYGPWVFACPALRKASRTVLLGGRPEVRLVHLQGDRAPIARRQAARHGHFTPVGLEGGQFTVLEGPAADQGATDRRRGVPGGVTNASATCRPGFVALRPPPAGLRLALRP